MRIDLALRITGLVAVAAVAAAACDTPAPSGAPDSPSSSAAPAPPACGADSVTRRSDYDAPLRCVLHDARFPRLTFDYSDPGFAGPAGRDQVIVVREGERVVQTITERTISYAPGTPLVPRWANDGNGQLAVVTNSGGTGGVGLAVWRARGPEGPFVRGGELFGFPWRTATTDEGFTALYAHGSAASGGYTIFRLVGDRVVGLFSLPVAVAGSRGVSLDGAGPIVTNRNTACRAETPTPAQARALGDAGVTAAGYGERLCRQAWVGRTYAG
ncbi:hypothetical protein [Tsukamurella ocularis]|uniref:hypothetical protein n=1 Tax=Tsukamurella ocularis TaxID=1970234 RepID=UPI00216872C5|nr:hypothetical protein [Tsukamurella ocularis]MCS3778689.1 hypothetical protein [Tsukamurella ocularis]MCS3789390.1 hypothetical protein [Tsukamurella ocularis]MCS3851372.1 hypothetical protein [Tsukamurella ocularis]